MNAKRFLVGLSLAAVAAAVCTLPFALSAASVSTTMAVSASVSALCTVGTAPVAFGAYDPITANATAPVTAQGSVTVTCTKGVIPTVSLDLGTHASGANRQMAAGSNNLGYQLYSDSGYANVWDTTNTVVMAGAPSKAARTLTVYGRVPGGQDVPVGSYTDTITATVNY